MKIKALSILLFGVVFFNGCAVKSIEELKPQIDPVVKALDINTSGEVVEKKEKFPFSLSQPKIAEVKVEPYKDKDGDYVTNTKLYLLIKETEIVETQKHFNINKKD